MPCRSTILSNDTADFIFNVEQLESSGWNLDRFCLQRLSAGLGVAYIDRGLLGELNIQTFGYVSIPKLFTTVDTGSMEEIGVLRIRGRDRLSLRGKGVIIGLVDTGIDYRHTVFTDEIGRTRIVRIWDQTVQTGMPPAGFDYGTEFTQEEIQVAITSADPLSLVPVTDVADSHGTFLASIAAGREDTTADFVGAASEAMLAVVKLKPAKPYLREFWSAGDRETIYQENDIMTGIQYLLNVQAELDMPMVIFCGLGGNSGGHSGNSFLSRMFTIASRRNGVAVVLPTGNETNRAHHFLGNISEEGGTQDVEIRVPEDTDGFTLELWANAPEEYSVGLRSPGGETIPRIPARLNSSSTYNLILEETSVTVDYRLADPAYGSQAIILRFRRPSEGVWTVQVTNDLLIDGVYHMWLPVTGLADNQPTFLTPNPFTTLTTPSAAREPISVAAYDHRNDSIYLHSGRGFTRTGVVKPDLTAPGVNVYGALSGGRFGTKTGTSVAAAHGAGAAALLMEWGLVRGNRPNLSTAEIKSYLIRGAKRDPDIDYPSPIWGYGKLDIYGVFAGLSG